jgi:hypothetical protein
MLGRCVSGVGSNDDVSNFPEVNNVQMLIWKFLSIFIFSDRFPLELIQLNHKILTKNFPLFFYFQIYTEWANYYLERAKSKRTVTDLSGKLCCLTKLRKILFILRQIPFNKTNSRLPWWITFSRYHWSCHQL